LVNLLRGWSGEIPASSPSRKRWLRVDMRIDSLAHYRVTAPLNAANAIQAVRTAPFRNTLFREEDGAYFSSLHGELWLEVAFAKSGKGEFKLTPYAMATPVGAASTELTIPLVDNIPRAFTIERQADKLSVLSNEMEPGQPVVGIYTERKAYFYPHGIPVQAGQHLASSQCITIDFPEDSHKLIAWNATPSKNDSRAYARIRQQAIALGTPSFLSYGHQQWTANGPASKQYKLPERGFYLIRIKIPAGGLAIWKAMDENRQLYAANTELRLVEFRVETGNLVLVNTAGENQFFVELISIAGEEKMNSSSEPLQLTLEKGIEKSFSHRGEIIVQLPQIEATTPPPALPYEGAVEEVSWYGASGLLKTDLQSGEILASPSKATETISRYKLGGFLIIRHGAGWIKLNLAERDSVFARKWEAEQRPQNPIELSKPVEVTLKDGLNWFAFTFHENVHVRFQSDQPMVGIVKAGEQIINYKTAFEALDWDMPLKPGKYFLGLRGLANAPLDGVRITCSSRSIDVLTEKSPPTISLAPNETRILRFTLPEQKIIGIGLRTQKEVVQARLYDGDWRLINRGKQQFKTLEKGDYYLWLHVPSSQDATTCTPILVGQEAPPNQPPEAVVRRIVEER